MYLSQIVDNVLPVFVLIALGKLLALKGWAPQAFFTASDRLVYFVFFPALLFWKIGAAGSELVLPLGLVGAVLLSVTAVWGLSLLYCRLAGVSPYQAGTFSQVSYRFNTYIGMAVVLSAFGEEGIGVFGVIISVAIPFINLLAVGTLVWFSQAEFSGMQKGKLVIKAILVNPLILACLAGIAWAHSGLAFPVFVQRSFALSAALSLPLALLSIGNSLALDKLKGRLGLSFVSCVLKLGALPLVGWALLSLAGVSGLGLAVAMVFLSLPTATSAYVLSTQMNSDADLAGAAIVLSTLLGFFSLSLVVLLFA
ncbi:MAG: AEC family transporter [Desulfarculaceae bacterium]|nr:AEC family transporter [Desulfarculaceae bacterium]MCF8073689.1 AEC family transporter [Desulfarculaceae bacterium]MCF8101930.1 AEC family transporter [Desulfarculaceae bacterium]MCF8117647.1 AEC family transporter [Desulfarculaceae bacterium]